MNREVPGLAQDVKDVFRGHGHRTEAGTAGYGTGVASGYTSLDNYNFAEGALKLRSEHYEVCDSKTFVVVEVLSSPPPSYRAGRRCGWPARRCCRGTSISIAMGYTLENKIPIRQYSCFFCMEVVRNLSL